MSEFQALLPPGELTRDQLTRVIRPFWALSRLREIDPASPSFHRLLDAYERLHGFAPPR